jgi:solute carrier family 25 2-oxodicarboxylate transporter 21
MSTQTQQKTEPKKLAPPPMWHLFLSGAVAGSAECAITFPIETLKTRAQLATHSVTMVGLTRDILKNEGVLAFYRGLASPLVGEAIKRSVKFGCNDIYKNWFRAKDGSLSNAGAAGAGVMVGFTEAIANCPFEVVKLRMQAPENKALYANTWDCLKKILQQEGPKALYTGFDAQILRNCVWNGTYFGIIGSIKNTIPKDATPQQQHFYSLCAGFIGGCLASTMNISFDTAKSRIQAQPPNLPKKYHYAIPTLISIVKNEGWRAAFKGLGPKVLKLGPGGALMSVIYDKCLETLRTFQRVD